jgi:hypothetical protein
MEFLLINVSDIRPVPLTTDCAMKLAWDARPALDRPDPENQEAFLRDWSRRQFGAEAAPEIAALYRDYFAIPSHRADVRQGDNAPHTYLKQLSADALPLVRGGKPLPEALLKTVATRLASASANRDYLAPLLARAEAQAAQIPAGRRDFYETHLLTALRIHLHAHEILAGYCRALQSLAAGDRPGAITHLEHALAAADETFGALRSAERGRWPAWYFGEGLVWLDGSRDVIRSHLAALRGEPPPPLRVRRSYEEIYEYQERFRQNFPLLYGPSGPR